MNKTLHRAMVTMLGAAGLLAAVGRQHGSAQETSTIVAPATAPTGGQLFHERGCSYCHGDQYAGTVKGPSLLSIGSRLDRSRIERQIRDGGGSMPAFGEVLEPPEVQSLVELLALKKSTNGPKQRR